MGQRPRARPKHLASKLLAIRQRLGLSQPQMAKALDLKVAYSRISEYEHGIREPSLITLLNYSQIAGLHTETLINDKVGLPAKLTRTRRFNKYLRSL